ncbi:MAG: glycosyltransferase family 39 protein [Chloroflexi bacterium]|nr:glycosyltransferase family 39 protein [Chloroflexota bacterium]
MEAALERHEALGPRAVTEARVRPRWNTTVAVVLAAVGLFTSALIPRMAVISSYVTTDEGNWMGRTALFARALRDNDPMTTYQSGHPGVTTMWTTYLGLGAERAIGLADYVRPDGLEKAPNYLNLLREGRRFFPVVTSLAVVVLWLLVWRLFGPGLALLAGVLLAVEPFFMAHSYVAHVDGSLTSYMNIAFFSALVYASRRGGRGYLVLCGIATGLAFLTKAPASFLALFIPLIAVAAFRAQGRLHSLADLRRLVLDGLTWVAVTGVVCFALWPALRTDPVATLTQMVTYTEEVGGSDHENVCFGGQPCGDPGPLFYPVAAGFRLTPVTMLGVALLLVNLVVTAVAGHRWPGLRIPKHRLAVFLALFAFILLFMLMMTSAPKKFDRYILPTFPSVELLAAAGIWLTVTRLARGRSARILPAVALLVGIVQIWPALAVFPYYLSYYNPLLGGGPRAAKNIVVGWGEGIEQVTSYLNAKPDSDRLTISGFYPRVMMAQFNGKVLPDKQYDPAATDYIVLYINALQRDLASNLRQEARGRKAELIIRINGIEYARLYSVPPPPNHSAAGTEFSGVARLERTYLKSDERRYLKSVNINPGDTLMMTLRWSLLQPMSSDLYGRVAVVDKRGRTVVDSTERVGGQVEGTAGAGAGTVLTEVHRLPLPEEAQGDVQLVVSLLDGPNGRPIDITSWPDKLTPDLRRPPNGVVADGVNVE